ncbi:MAG: RES family NAD+ phosphorylase [Actinomycetota bacterium]|nr:RES family NAD+ phosphorylase [Actinomycetota bacterium]
MAALRLPPDFERKRLHVVRRSGPWQRLHPEEYSALYFGKDLKNRFDDPRSKYGVLYVAEDEFGAFVETFLRNPSLTLVAKDELVKRRLSEIEASADLSLVDLTGKGLQHAGVTGEISTAPHDETWALSRAIHDHPSRPDGIRYRLKHDLERIGIAIFDRVEVVGLGVRSRGSLADPSNVALLGKILEEYGKDYI